MENPDFYLCKIVWTDDPKETRMKVIFMVGPSDADYDNEDDPVVGIGKDGKTEYVDSEIFFTCQDKDEFASLLKIDNGEDFYITEVIDKI